MGSVWALGIGAAILTACASIALAGPGGVRPIDCVDAAAPNGSDDCAQSAPGLVAASDVAVSPDGRSLYAVGFDSDSITRFKVNRQSGALTFKGCVVDADSSAIPGCTVAGSLDGPADVEVSPDGRSVYVLANGDDGISIFARSRNGAISPAGCVQDDDIAPAQGDCSGDAAIALEFPRGLAISPDGRTVYGSSAFDDAVQVLKRNRRTGALTPTICIEDPTGPESCAKQAAGLSAPAGLVVAPDGRSVYVAGKGEHAVVQLKRNRASGKLKAGMCVADDTTGPAACTKDAPGIGDADGVALGPEGRSAYVLGGTAIVHMKVAGNGALKGGDCIDDWASQEDCRRTALMTSPGEAVIARGSRWLYMSAFGDDSIVAFSRNPRSGKIAPEGCTSDEDGNGGGPFERCTASAPGLNGVGGLALGHRGKQLFTASNQDDAVTVFRLP